jgi:hypothetical protein
MSTFDQVEKNIQQGAEYIQSKMKDAMPKVSFNKNGYEIRTQVLDLAKQWNEFEYTQKISGWEISQKRDKDSGHIITTVGMPAVPGVDQVLATAEKFYNFINNSNK